MGKKMGINTKAVEARERRDNQKKVKQEALSKQKEDEFWRDNDKHVNRKLDRQREREQKAQEERDRKAALKVAYERDMEIAERSAKAKASGAKHNLVEVPKVTRSQIERNLEEANELATTSKQLSKQLKKVNLVPVPLVPNLNHVEEEAESASTIDQALDIFKSGGELAPTSAASTSRRK